MRCTVGRVNRFAKPSKVKSLCRFNSCPHRHFCRGMIESGKIPLWNSEVGVTPAGVQIPLPLPTCKVCLNLLEIERR